MFTISYPLYDNDSLKKDAEARWSAKQLLKHTFILGALSNEDSLPHWPKSLMMHGQDAPEDSADLDDAENARDISAAQQAQIRFRRQTKEHGALSASAGALSAAAAAAGKNGTPRKSKLNGNGPSTTGSVSSHASVSTSANSLSTPSAQSPNGSDDDDTPRESEILSARNGIARAAALAVASATSDGSEMSITGPQGPMTAPAGSGPGSARSGAGSRSATPVMRTGTPTQLNGSNGGGHLAATSTATSNAATRASPVPFRSSSRGGAATPIADFAHAAAKADSISPDHSARDVAPSSSTPTMSSHATSHHSGFLGPASPPDTKITHGHHKLAMNSTPTTNHINQSQSAASLGDYRPPPISATRAMPPLSPVVGPPVIPAKVTRGQTVTAAATATGGGISNDYTSVHAHTFTGSRPTRDPSRVIPKKSPLLGPLNGPSISMDQPLARSHSLGPIDDKKGSPTHGSAPLAPLRGAFEASPTTNNTSSSGNSGASTPLASSTRPVRVPSATTTHKPSGTSTSTATGAAKRLGNARPSAVATTLTTNSGNGTSSTSGHHERSLSTATVERKAGGGVLAVASRGVTSASRKPSRGNTSSNGTADFSSPPIQAAFTESRTPSRQPTTPTYHGNISLSFSFLFCCSLY
jgi:hypothetical protein